MSRLLVGGCVLALAGGCLRGPTCAENGCPDETVCDLDGTCRPLTVRPRRVRDRHLPAADFGGTRADRRRESAGDLDELLLGGYPEGAVYLAFDLPEGTVEEAILVLHPAEGARGGDQQTIRVARVRSFEGATLTHRSRPRIQAFGPARTLSPVPDRPVRLDVTSLVDEDEHRLHLAAMGGGEGVPWRIASPIALDAERAPHLELRLHPRERPAHR